MNTGSRRSVHHPDHNKRHQQAREWLVIRPPQQDLPAALHKKWCSWIADDKNLTVFREYERVVTLLRALPRQPLPTDAELHAAVARRAAAAAPRASAAATQSPELPQPQQEQQPRHRIRSPGLSTTSQDQLRRPSFSGFLRKLKDTLTPAAIPRVSIAMALAAIAAGVLLYRAQISSMLFPPQAHTYQTTAGHLLTVTLPDHSVLKLGGASRLSVLVSNETRHITLYEGEAMFEVTHNPRVPFEVDVDATRVTDVGTSFHVRRYTDKQVIVEVVKGRVDVAPRQEEAVVVTVTEGESVSSDGAGRITPAHPSDFQALTWWLYGRRVYREKPLGRVIEDLQLYFPRLIEFDRTQVGSMPFTGILDPNNPEESLHGLEEVLPVEIDETDPQRVVIRCRKGACRQP